MEDKVSRDRRALHKGPQPLLLKDHTILLTARFWQSEKVKEQIKKLVG